MNDSHPSILYKTVRIPFVQYFQYLRRKHLSGIYPALENLYFVLEQHLNMIISKDIHPLNPLTQNHLPDRELLFHRFVVQLLQFMMGIHMTFQLTQHFFVNLLRSISALCRASLTVLNPVVAFIDGDFLIVLHHSMSFSNS